MSRNYLVEMLKVLCTKCEKEIWCFVRSQEEINNLHCKDCLRQSEEQIEEKETTIPQIQQKGKIKKKRRKAQK